MDVRPYDPDRDREALWALKRAFELELGAEGGDGPSEAYASKLSATYRKRYLQWVDRCIGKTRDCVTVADGAGELAGYAFLLPESLAMIWDGAVLNEIYVVPDERGTGLADELLDAVTAVASAQSLPMDRLVLDVAPTNERAVGFYERHGFEPWGELVRKQL